MTSANQTPGGFKFAPLVASQQGKGQANQHEPACFGLSSPWSFPSRSGIPLHAVVQPCLSATIYFAMKYFRPLFCRSAPFPLVLGCSRPLVGVDAESSEFVQETPHTLFFLAPCRARTPHYFSEHGNLEVALRSSADSWVRFSPENDFFYYSGFRSGKCENAIL